MCSKAPSGNSWRATRDTQKSGRHGVHKRRKGTESMAKSQPSSAAERACSMLTAGAAEGMGRDTGRKASVWVWNFFSSCFYSFFTEVIGEIMG